MENRRSKNNAPQKKTEYERRHTREEVEQIKRDLINYAKTFWGQKWIHSNLQIGRPFRMQRGIEYANDESRIDNVSISKGQIFATVQGTIPTPYRVKINFEIIPEEGWQKIIKNLEKYPLNLIEMLEGKMPLDIVSLFENNGYSLFPTTEKKMEATCSCPDKEIPCKHIAAVILYIARVLDYDPLILLELKGKSKKELLNDLQVVPLGDGDKNPEIKLKKEDNEHTFNVPRMKVHDLVKEHKKIKEKVYSLNFSIKKPGKLIETIENLGSLPNVETKAFEIVLKDIYKKVAFSSYKMSLD